MTAIRFRVLDYLLICLGVRRLRCDFCSRLQWTWLLPRPLRWGLAIVLLGVVYVASTGPVKWLHDNYRMSETTYNWMDRWVYWPLNRWVGAPQEQGSTLSNSLRAYREWWSPTSQSLRSNDVQTYDAATTPRAESDDSGPQRLDLPPVQQPREHSVGRPTGEPPQQ